MQRKSPVEAIGKSKELIESCCKTILTKYKVQVESNWSVSRLCKETMSVLEITSKHVSEDFPEGAMIKRILGNLQGIASTIAELRNVHGSGHGKSANYSGLNERHAKLAVGSSITLVTYLWDTYEWRNRI